MSSDFDAVACEEGVELTTRFLVELQDNLNETVAAFLLQRFSEIGSDLIGLHVLVCARLVFRADSRPKVPAEKVWSQREASQQCQHQEAFCSINQYQRRHSPSEVWPVQDKQPAQTPVQGSCQMLDWGLDHCLTTT